MKICVINGPNLNLLGVREPEVYGHQTYGDLVRFLEEEAAKLEIALSVFQSNQEGELVSMIHSAYFDKADGIIINPAAYTHTSVALLDALSAVPVPAVEVHLSNIAKREEFRQTSFVSKAAVGTIAGFGFKGYVFAMQALKDIFLRGDKGA